MPFAIYPNQIKFLCTESTDKPSRIQQINRNTSLSMVQIIRIIMQVRKEGNN